MLTNTPIQKYNQAFTVAVAVLNIETNNAFIGLIATSLQHCWFQRPLLKKCPSADLENQSFEYNHNISVLVVVPVKPGATVRMAAFIRRNSMTISGIV